MARKPKRKAKQKQLTPAEAAARLRQLADALEGAALPFGDTKVCLGSGEVSIRETLAGPDGEAKLTVKLSLDPECLDEQPDGLVIGSEGPPPRKPATARPEARATAKAAYETRPPSKAGAAPGARAASKTEAAAARAPRRRKKKTGYKKLKSEMKKTWKAIRTAVQAGEAPPVSVIRQLVAQSDQMCSYPDKGAEYYPPYLAAVAKLQKALETGDPAAATAAVAEVRALEKACHKRYK